ncbi:hypothetical protein AGMMS49921_04170 [Endomicrobiia bacterium]|nr:hypothetical protein AGMMS49921_04170 [Endomicrobiia bacterium]
MPGSSDNRSKSSDTHNSNSTYEDETLKNKKVREMLDKTWKTTLRELTDNNRLLT